MDAEVYPDPRVVQLVEEHFVPVRVHVKEQADDFKRLGARYGAQWTPTILVLDSSGEERHRTEGFLPADDFIAQLVLGLAKSAFARGDFAEAERRFREIVDRYPSTDAAPEALYWAGVARYKATNDPAALAATAAAFRQRYQETSWAKKASVWG
ncbi:MAG: thioredoxin fold domain-containing protein [Vicinamibacterales bacterium]